MTARLKRRRRKAASTEGASRNGKPWEPAEDAFLEANYTGVNALEDDELARRLNRRKGAIVSRASLKGLHRHPEWLLSKGTVQGVRDRLPGGGKAWPPHRFEDDEREAARPFNPDLRYSRRPVDTSNRTYGGVASTKAAYG